MLKKLKVKNHPGLWQKDRRQRPKGWIILLRIFAIKNDDPELFNGSSNLWDYKTHQLDHFEKAQKILRYCYASSDAMWGQIVKLNKG